MTIIIPSKTISNLIPCLGAIRAHENPRDVSVIVIDDGLQIEPRHPALDGVLVLPGIKPFIYARNCNRGILAADPDDVILLNDDAMLHTPGGFSALAAAAAQYTSFGIISATTNIVGNPAQKPRGGKGLREEPRCLAFVCVYIPRRTIDAVGLLDERYTAYGWEDNDYCRRVREAGLKLGICEGCYVDHGSLRSTFRGAALAPGNIAAGAQIYREKWGDLA